MLPRLLLIGAGSAHLHALRLLARRQTPARETVLVATAPTVVSPDMLPGFLAGRFRAEEVVIDLARLAHAAGGSLVVGNVATLEPASRTVRLEGGRALLYNAASLTVDPHPPSAPVPGAIRYARFIHSVAQVMALPPLLEQAVTVNPGSRILVVGSGAQALEMAMALRQQTHRLDSGKSMVTIVSTSHTLWGERGTAARYTEAALRRNNISIIAGARIVDVELSALQLSNGARVAFDFLLWAGDGELPRYISHSGLPTTADGALLVDAFLQSTEAPGLFATSPAAVIANHPDGAQVSQDPAREGATIAANLLNVLRHEPPSKTFDLPARSVAWMDTADGRAIVSFGDFAAEGKWVSRLKERRDRLFTQQISRQGN
jgi:NADH dehydrogenase FAD-containing subunit